MLEMMAKVELVSSTRLVAVLRMALLLEQLSGVANYSTLESLADAVVQAVMVPTPRQSSLELALKPIGIPIWPDDLEKPAACGAESRSRRLNSKENHARSHADYCDAWSEWGQQLEN